MKQAYRVIGIMSGTSLDGVDLVYAEIVNDVVYEYKIIEGVTYPYSEAWLALLKGSFSKSKEELEVIDIQYGEVFGKFGFEI